MKKDYGYLVGKTFNGIKILETGQASYVGKKRIEPRCICECYCGHKWSVMIKSITSGDTKSCGCKKIQKTHGMWNTRIRHIYDKMKQRCNNPNHTAYHNYGGRGIKCMWANFESFRDDMYESYLEHEKIYGTLNTTLDRINNNKSYFKENCKWSTIKEQANNTRSNRLLTFNGVTKNIQGWAEFLNLPNGSTHWRLIRLGMTPDEVLNSKYKSLIHNSDRN